MTTSGNKRLALFFLSQAQQRNKRLQASAVEANIEI